MYGFSKKTLDYLQYAGWYECRECEQLDEYKRILNQEEFELSDTIEQFLKSFGGLLVKHPHAMPNVIDYVHFDVIKAINGSDPDWVKDWLETEFAFFLAQSYRDLKWQHQTPDDTFDFTFHADGKQYAINIEQYQPTQTGLKKLIEGDWNKHLQRTDYDNCALTLVGIHPKTEMKPADIEKFVMTETKKVGLEIPHYDIKTAFIPKTDYAFTAVMIEP